MIFPGVCISSYLGKRYMCLKLSIAMSGKSSFDFPRWWSGCANFSPSAIKKFTFSESNIEIIVVLNQWWEEVSPPPLHQCNVRNQIYLRLSSNRYFCTTSVYSLTDSLSSGLWNRMRNGRPSSVSSSAFSKVISRTNGEHLSEAHALISS